MEVLHVSDTHLGSRWSLIGAPTTLRATDHLRALELALAPALAGEVDLVVHTGDLFDHREPDRVAAGAARELLGAVSRRVPVWVLPGNHDRAAVARVLEGIPGIDIAGGPVRWEAGSVRFGLVPYVRSAAEFAAACSGWEVDVLLAHQAFDGHRVPGFTFRASQRTDTLGAEHLPPAVRFVMCGHLHPRQVVRVGGATVVCPGSTERTAFSEADQTKGYARWSLLGGGHERVHFVDLPTRPLRRVGAQADLDRVAPGDVVRCSARWEKEVRARGAFCRLERAQLPLFGARTPPVAIPVQG